MVDGEVKFGLFRCIMACAAKNKERVEIQSVHSVLGCTGSCGNTPHKKLKKKKKGLE